MSHEEMWNMGMGEDPMMWDILHKRPYEFYWTNLPFQHDPEYWHEHGIRLGEA